MNKTLKCRKTFSLLVLVMLCLFCGCGIEKTDGNKLKDLEYEFVEEEDIPEELFAKIEEKKAADFKLVYETEKELYVVRGYGEQETGGYSIQILDFYLTKNAIVFSSNLLGPAKDDVKNLAPSYPYVVLKTENMNKNVIFD
ncbi:MAG: protease complex subunit PrcB family protein [Lachnospiraceae bacterium]|nr:protease complex subunit PrcB family protein [Lachnospiraceae bacterium]